MMDEMEIYATGKTLICLFDRFEIRQRFDAARAGSHAGSIWASCNEPMTT